MNQELAPICLFVYNRYKHTLKTIEALKENKLAEQSDIYIFSDAAKNNQAIEPVQKIRNYIKLIDGFKSVTIIESSNNKGLANSIISGVTDVINKHGKVIVFEDDLISSPLTLEYLNLMLNTYQNFESIMSITSYSYPSSTVKIGSEYGFDNYFSGRPCSWGWATWKDRWTRVQWDGKVYEDYLYSKRMQEDFKLYAGRDIDRMLKKQLKGEIDSWAVRFVFNCFLLKKLASYPVKSYISNIGTDGSGTHKGVNESYIINRLLNEKLPTRLSYEFEVNDKILKEFNKFVKKKYYFKRLMRLLKSKFQ
ncbi:glycosyltransferase [Citrobacter amalonaticus]|uniref:hypothetical protein n=1 Tax=Citrobacter amalonaticus TaxID=35703 RepID=UPI0027EA3950|nr:glycosyltransferase [Citrobacter amalonaticus]